MGGLPVGWQDKLVMTIALCPGEAVSTTAKRQQSRVYIRRSFN
jgi:hypothetical protein